MYAYYELGRTSTHGYPDSGGTGRHVVSGLRYRTAQQSAGQGQKTARESDPTTIGGTDLAYAASQDRTRSEPSLSRCSADGWWPSAALEHLS